MIHFHNITPRRKSASGYRFLFLILTAVLLVFLTLVLYFLPFLDGYKRQAREESIAITYLENYIQTAAPKEPQKESASDWNALEETAESQEFPPHSSDDAPSYWKDTVYYERDGTAYTPDYAAGILDCVLIIPKIQLCRGVYTGTMEDILHNLDVWMLTVSQPQCQLGETSYCIYGHNTPRLNLSFNRLQTLKLQDTFYLLNSSGEYCYTVTDIFGTDRSQTAPYTQADAGKAEKCFLLTCGRDEYRYLDLVVEGTLKSFRPIETVDIREYFLLSDSQLPAYWN